MPGVELLAGDVAINIPQIELQNIGKDQPMSTPEIVNLVIKTVLTAAIESGGGIIPGDILGELGNGLSSLSSLSDMGVTALNDAGQVVGEQLDQVLQDAGAVIDDAANQATEAIDNLTENLPDDLGEQVGEDLENTIDNATEEVKKGLGNLLGGNKDD